MGDGNGKKERDAPPGKLKLASGMSECIVQGGGGG